MSVRDSFLAAIDFIEAHLGEPLSLSEVAAQAGFSPAYFSRLFRVLTGAPFGAYVRHRRLSEAADRLRREGDRVELMSLALDCQYESQEAFSRAFKKAFGVPPGSYRAHPARELMHLRERITPASLAHLKEVVGMQPEIQTLETFVVAGIQAPFDQGSKHQIPLLWKQLFERFDSIPTLSPGVTYGVCSDADPEEGRFDYLAGAEVPPDAVLPKGIVAVRIPAGMHAVFRHRVTAGSLHESLQETLRWIWGVWLPASRFKYRAAPDFERYPEDFDPASESSYLEIAIPIEPRT